MESLPCELRTILYSFLNSQDNLMFSTCAKTNIDRYYHRVQLTLPFIYYYFVPHPKNIMFFNNSNIQLLRQELQSMSPIEKNACSFSLMNMYLRNIMEYIKYDNYVSMPLYPFGGVKHYYTVDRIGYSTKPWGDPNDTSHIAIQKKFPIKVSLVYHVRTPSRQLNLILQSPQLKALIG